MTRTRLPWLKFFGTWGLFLLLHFSYETFPNTLFRAIGEEGETTFFHMKMLFFAYLATSIVEFLVRRKRIAAVGQFVSARLLVAVVYPWLAITLWFTAQALGIQLPVVPWEIVYANVATAIGVYFALRLEEVLDAAAFRPSLHALVGIVFAAALLSYVAFSFSTPQHFFTTPLEQAAGRPAPSALLAKKGIEVEEFAFVLLCFALFLHPLAARQSPFAMLTSSPVRSTWDKGAFCGFITDAVSNRLFVAGGSVTSRDLGAGLIPKGIGTLSMTAGGWVWNNFLNQKHEVYQKEGIPVPDDKRRLSWTLVYV